jgi:hypothetical protein
MESQVAAAAELKSSHESNLAAVQTHTDQYLKEEYSVYFFPQPPCLSSAGLLIDFSISYLRSCMRHISEHLSTYSRLRSGFLCAAGG